MLKIHPITKDSKDFQMIETLYTSTFPEAEQAPMWFLLRRAKKDHVEFNAYYDGDVLAGFTYLISHETLTLVMYIAIDANHRSKGYGSQIMNYIREAYPNNRIILNIEMEDENSENNAQRKKRKQFYIRNGYGSSGIFLEMKGVTYEALISNGDCTVREFLALNKKFMGSLLFPFIKPKLIQRPNNH